jgi:alpha/beta superfamily hydrolase
MRIYKMTLKIPTRHGYQLSALVDGEASITKARQIVVVSHGLLTHKSTKFNSSLSSTLAENGLTVVRFDFEGCGESEGDLKDLTPRRAQSNVEDVVMNLREQNATARIGLFGTCFGGYASLLAASDGPAKDVIKGLCVRCVMDSADWDGFWRNLYPDAHQTWEQGNCIPHSFNSKTHPISYKFHQETQEVALADVVAQIDVPAKVLNGDQDEFVNLGRWLETKERFRDCRLDVLSGCDHNYTQPEHRSVAIGKAVRFFKKMI